MGESWIVERGDYAVLIALALGGYLAAASVLWQWKPSGPSQQLVGLLIAAAIVFGVLTTALSPFILIIGAVATIFAWGITVSGRPGIEIGIAHIFAVAIISVLGALRPEEATVWTDYWQREPDIAARIGVYLAAYALVTVPAAEVIGHGIKALGLGPGKPKQGEDTGPGRGRIIGIMERAILLTLGLLGQWQAIGLVVAAKSIARYKNLDEQEFAEYYLIGTLASLLTALLIGIGAQLIT